eukprot:GILI01016213.1.p1 GENE.GILI01016213.1~~GILI01016213.1.p1  ORF type:complete len:398 (+),score=102.19 GILI01016213.1:126-1319(+)
MTTYKRSSPSASSPESHPDATPSSSSSSSAAHSNADSLEGYVHPPIQFPILMCLINGLREYLFGQICWGSDLLIKYVAPLRCSALDIYCRTASFVGSQSFYVIVIPLLQWFSSSPFFARSCVMLFYSSTSVCNWLKNLLSLPRPPASCLHKGRCLDNHGFGWPSSHAANALALPFFVGRYISGMTPLQVLFSLSFYGFQVYFFAALWLLSVSASRLYLGVHSPADIHGGMIVGGLLLQVWTSFCEDFDRLLFVTSSTIFVFLAATVVIGSFWALVPKPQGSYQSYEETVIVIGSLYGFILGCKLRGEFAMVPSSWLLLGLRAVLGFLAIICTYFVIKYSTRAFFGALCPRRKQKGEDAHDDEDPYSVSDYLSKFFTYGSLNFCAAYLAPLLFRALAI